MLAEFKALGGGVAAVALSGVATGIGTVFSGFLQAYAQNPREGDALFTYTILGFALTESMGLFALMIVFLILFG